MIAGAGLLLIGWLVLMTIAAATSPPRARVAVLCVAIPLWFVGYFGMTALLGFEMLTVDKTGGFTSCAVPGNDSESAPSTWSWLPPGKACQFTTGTQRPTWWRVPALAALVVLPFAWAVMWPDKEKRARDRSPESVAALSAR